MFRSMMLKRPKQDRVIVALLEHELLYGQLHTLRRMSRWCFQLVSVGLQQPASLAVYTVSTTDSVSRHTLSQHRVSVKSMNGAAVVVESGHKYMDRVSGRMHEH